MLAGGANGTGAGILRNIASFMDNIAGFMGNIANSMDNCPFLK